MEIKKLPLGALKANCYLLIKDKDCLIIDPGAAEQKLFDNLSKLNVKGILLTHSHFDHIGGVKDIEKLYKTKTYNYNNLKEGIKKIANFEFEVIYNPGHSNDSISIYFKKEKIMFTGDFIFKNSIGRVDLETSNPNDMKKSIKNFKKLDECITLYPGHGEKTTLKDELNNNYFLNNEMPF